jgi:hypothetical protein
MYRSIFSGEKTSSLDGLTIEDLEFIKTKYGLIWPNECPTTINKPKFIENTYNKYDWNKLKVYLDPMDKTTDINEEDITEDTTKNTTDKQNNDDNKINNVYLNDKFFTQAIADKSLNKNMNDILAQATKEQNDLLDANKGKQLYNKDNLLEINNIYKNNSVKAESTASTIINNLTQQPPKPQVTDQIGASLPPLDTFFSKFMKVVLPAQ